MATIESISVAVKTGDVKGGSTNGRVYLGLGGREFRLDTSDDDFKRNALDCFRLGDGDNVRRAERNDPRNPAVDTADLEQFPTYIRFEGKSWNLRFVSVEVAGTGFGADLGPDGLWMGHVSGKTRYLFPGRFGEFPC